MNLHQMFVDSRRVVLFMVVLLMGSVQLCMGQYEPKAKGELVRHKYYSLDYNESYEQANWVYYKMTVAYLDCQFERSSSFYADPSVKTGSATPSDYTKSGYDRGHLCPAGDMGFSAESMRESFYMSNMSPQHPSLNRGKWKQLEDLVRVWCAKEKVIYVVAGGLFNHPLGVIGTNKVTIPGSYYKIIYAPESQKMIAFVMPNEKLNLPVQSYVTTVDSIEKLTGIDFFYQLDDDVENRLERSSSTQGWTFTITK